MNNMFEKDITKEELVEMLKDSFETTHIVNKHIPMRLYNMAKEEFKRAELKKNIIDKMYQDDKRKVVEVVILEENLAIIKTFEKLFDNTEKNWYRVFYNGRVESSCTDNYDHALIMAVCAKTNNLINSDASVLISRMLNVKLDEY